MNLQDIVDDIKLQLGGSVLRLELSDEDIARLIRKAYRKMKPYIAEEKYITKIYTPSIDLRKDGVYEVIRCFRTTQSVLTGNRLFDFETIDLRRDNIRKYILGSYPVVDDSVNFKFIDGFLYLDNNIAFQGKVTAQCLVTPTLDELEDERAVDWIQSYALALCKEATGRIRSKFKSANIPIELDGDTLLGEAQVERQALESDLTEKPFGPFVIYSDSRT